MIFTVRTFPRHKFACKSHGGYQKINRVGLHQTRISITSMTTRAVVGILVGSQTMDML